MYEIYEYMPLLFNNIVKIRSCILFVTEGTFYYFNTMLAIFLDRSGSPKGQRNKKSTSVSELTEERSATGQSKKSSSHHSLMDSHTQHRPPAALTATTTSEIILVISPVVRPQYIGIIIASCQRKGFRIRGVKRQKLTSKKVASLG